MKKCCNLKLCSTLVVLILLFSFSFAQKLKFVSGSMPAYPHPVSFTQPDGSNISITLKGDEFLNWAKTSDGYTLVKNGNNGFEFGILDEGGNLVPSGKLAKDAAKRDDSDLKFLKSVPKNLMFSKEQIMNETKKRESISKSANAFPSTGNNRLLMILVNFNNTSTTYTQTNFNNFMNQTGYNYQGSTGSFRDYYLASSLGQDTINTTVMAWVTVNNTHNYYGPQNRWTQLAYDAIVAVHNANPTLDFSQFDNDGNGSVDGIAIVHQGPGQEASGNSNDVWSHSSSIASSYNLVYNGVTVGSYTMQPETTNSGNMTPVGVMCHEFGHNLGLPDLYSTNYSSNGMGDWDIMAAGSWSNSGRTPPVHNAWSKYALGWITPVTINTPTIDTLRDAYTNPDCFRLNINGTGSGSGFWNEYFLLENRQRTGWNAYLPGHGMIIYHIDGPGLNSAGAANNVPSHQYVDIEEADNTLTTNNSGDSGDPYPGTTNKTDFTDNTTPNSRSWASVNTAKSVNHITEITSSKLIIFWLMGGAPTTLISDFYANSTSINAGDSVNFYDNSGTPFSTTINGYQWSFPGGTPSSFNGQVPPPITYPAVGTYTVSLTVNNSASAADTATKVGYITVNPAVTCNWITQASNFATSGRGVIYLSIVDPNTVWGVGNNGTTGALLREYTRTTNGGNSWISGTMTGVTSGDLPSCICGVSGTKAYIVAYNSTSPQLGGVFVTNNGGTSWTKQTTAAFNSTSFPNIIHFFNATEGLCMGDPNGGYFEIYKTTNGGTNWVRVPTSNIPSPITGEYGYTNMYDAVGDTLWYATNKGRVYRTVDKGTNWTAYTVTGFTDFSRLTFNTGNDGFAQQLTYDTTTNTLTAHKERITHNGGQTWVSISQGPGINFGDIDGVPGVPGEYISVGRDSTVTNLGSSITYNYGVNWSAIDQGTQYISTKFFDANTGWAGGFNTSTTIGIYKYHNLITNNNVLLMNNYDAEFYPVPSSDYINIKLFGFPKQNLNIRIYNMIGILVYEKNEFSSGNSFSSVINVSDFPRGVYIAVIKSSTNSNKIVKKKIIVE